MPPDVKIRNLSPEVFQRLQERALGNGRSMEAELRAIVSDAVACTVTAKEWQGAGFEQVHEIVPGLAYEAWAKSKCFRIAIMRAITPSATAWTSSIDELSQPEMKLGDENRRVWFRPSDIAARHLGDSPDIALREAMMWLAEYAGVDPGSRARRTTGL